MDPPIKKRKTKIKKKIKMKDDDIFDQDDLPLLANVADVKVVHYILKLDFHMQKKSVAGTAVLFVQPVKQNTTFEIIILDACSCDVQKVYLLRDTSNFDQGDADTDPVKGRKNFYQKHDTNWFDAEGQELAFMVDKWSIRIWDWPEGITPSVIRIQYTVSSSTPSLSWRPTDEWTVNGKFAKCVYTAAAAVNNRGLIPCQEPPSAMATWECFIKCEKVYLPLMSSEESAELIQEDEESHCFYFYSNIVLPMSTLALVIGTFLESYSLTFPVAFNTKDSNFRVEVEEERLMSSCNHEFYPCALKSSSSSSTISVRFYSLFPLEFLSGDKNKDDFTAFLVATITSAFHKLAPYPFSRVDFVVLSKYYSELGLCNPYMIFLSPSNFCGKEPLYLFRIPHEISHFWFGLSIGAMDWSEEFMSEGFATFMEDVLYKETMQHSRNEECSFEQIKAAIDTKACIRLLTLQNELKNTDSGLQILSQNRTASSSSRSLKNGLIPMKQFMQVHYLKGYFLLKYLSYLVGEERFVKFLRSYALKFHGRLVTSQEFFCMFFDTFSSSVDPSLNMEVLQSTWLIGTSLPEFLEKTNILSNEMHEDFLKIFPSCQPSLTTICERFEKVQTDSNLIELEDLSSNELLLFLEKFIELCSTESYQCAVDDIFTILYFKIIERLVYVAQEGNPDVCHRLCELILLHKDFSRISVIKGFLEKHQSMGVYLYGEMIITGKNEFKKFAMRFCKSQTKVMDAGRIKILKDMMVM